MKITTTSISALSLTVAALSIACISQASASTFVNFYSVTNQGTVGRLNPTYNFGQITAAAGQTTAGTVKSLTVANFAWPQPDEVGLGVCGSSDGGSLCNLSGPLQQVNQSTSLWSGDITEIDNLGDNEFITLTANAGTTFTGRFIVSSLDDNGNSNFEDGTVTYGANVAKFARTATGAAITSGSATIAQAGATYGANTFLITLTNFNPAVTQVTFSAGGTSGSGTNNDYLLGAAEVVPVPGAAWLFGSALGLLGLRRRANS